MPLDFKVEKIRVVTGSMEYTISAVATTNPNGSITEPSGSIIRGQDGTVWVNTNGGTVWARVPDSGTLDAAIKAAYASLQVGTSASDAAVQTSLKAGLTASFLGWGSDLSVAGSITGSGDVSFGRTGRFGQFIYAFNGATYMGNGHITYGYNSPGTMEGFINYFGYQGGFTQYRDLTIADGKGNVVANFFGQTRRIEFASDLYVTGSITGSGDGKFSRDLRVGRDVIAGRAVTAVGASNVGAASFSQGWTGQTATTITTAVSTNGTYDTTAGALTTYGVFSNAFASRSNGPQAFNQVAVAGVTSGTVSVTTGVAIYGQAEGGLSASYGVFGAAFRSQGTNYGGYFTNENPYGLPKLGTNYALYATGTVNIVGDLYVTGTLFGGNIASGNPTGSLIIQDLYVSGSLTGSGDVVLKRNVQVGNTGNATVFIRGDATSPAPVLEISGTFGHGMHIRGPQAANPSIRLQGYSSPSVNLYDFRLPRNIDEGEFSIHYPPTDTQFLLFDPRGKMTVWKDAMVGQNLIISGSITGSGAGHLFRRSSVPEVSSWSTPILTVEHSGTSTTMNFVGPSAQDKGIYFSNPSGLADGGIIYDNPSNAVRGLDFRTAGNISRLVINAVGRATFNYDQTVIGSITGTGDATFTRNVGIGVAAPLAKLHVAGTTYSNLFNFSSNEDTYIRAGKTAGIVYVGDVNTGISVGSAGASNTYYGSNVFTGVDYSSIINWNGDVQQPTYIRAGKVGGAIIIGDVNTGSIQIGNANNTVYVAGRTVLRGNVGTTVVPLGAVEFVLGRNGTDTLPVYTGDIAFGWGGGGYRHWISTNHDAAANSAGNAMRFWLNDSAASGGSSAPNTGSFAVLSLQGDRRIIASGSITAVGGLTGTNLSIDNQATFNNTLTVNGNRNSGSVVVSNSGLLQTIDMQALSVLSNGTFNTTAGARTNYGLSVRAAASRSLGANAFANVAVFGNPSGTIGNAINVGILGQSEGGDVSYGTYGNAFGGTRNYAGFFTNESPYGLPKVGTNYAIFASGTVWIAGDLQVSGTVTATSIAGGSGGGKTYVTGSGYDNKITKWVTATSVTSSIITETITAGGSVTQDATSLKYVPASQAEWTTLLAGTGLSAPNMAIVLCQEATGTLIDSTGQGFDFVPVNNPLHQQTVSGWSRKFVSFHDNSGDYFGATGPNPQSRSMTALYMVAVNSTPAGTRTIAEMNQDVYLALNSTPKFIGEAGGTSVTTTTPGSTVHFVVVTHNRTAGNNKVFVDGSADVISPTFYDATTVTDITLGHRTVGGSNSGPVSIGYVAYWTGSLAEMSDAQIDTLISKLTSGPTAASSRIDVGGDFAAVELTASNDLRVGRNITVVGNATYTSATGSAARLNESKTGKVPTVDYPPTLLVFATGTWDTTTLANGSACAIVGNSTAGRSAGSNPLFNIGILGQADNGPTINIGIMGAATSSAPAATNYGVYGKASNGVNNYGGWFEGNVNVEQTFTCEDLISNSTVNTALVTANDFQLTAGLGTLVSISATLDANRVTDGLDVLRGTKTVDDFWDDRCSAYGGAGAGTKSWLPHEPGHPGIVRLQATTSGTDAYEAYQIELANAGAVRVGGGPIQYEACVRIPTVDDGVQNAGRRAGVYLQTTGDLPTDGFWFEVNRSRFGDNEWRLRMAATGSQAALKTGVTIAANRWYRMRLDVAPNGNAVTGSIWCSGTLISTIATKTYVPQAGGAAPGVMILKNLGAVARTFDVDYMYTLVTFTGSRA